MQRPDAPAASDVQWCGDDQPHEAHPWSDVVCPGRVAAQGFDMRAAMLEDAKEKLRMIRDEPRFELLLPSEADEVLRALGEKS